MARASRLRIGTIVFVAGLAAPAIAQVPDEPPSIRPLPAGALRMYPLVSVSYEGTDNLFRRQDDRTSATIASALAGVLFEAPLRESELRFGYAGRLRRYGGVDIDDNVLHAARLDGSFRFSGGAYLDVDVDGQDGAEDTLRFDPGGEITYRGEQFSALGARVEVGHESGRGRRLGVRGETDRIRFDRTAQDAGAFFDTSTRSASVTASHRTGETTTLTWELTGTRQDLERPFPGSIDLRESRAWTASGGLRRRLGAGTRIDVLAGWTDREFDSTRSTSVGTVVGRASFVRQVPARATATLRVERAVYPSVYLDNDYYVSSQLIGQIENSARAPIVLGTRWILYRNAYPESDPDRTDDAVEASAWIGYGFRSGVIWKVTASWGRRDSTAESLGYDAFRVATSFELGTR